METAGERLCGDLIQLERAALLEPCWAGCRRSTFDCQYDDAASTLKDRHRKSGGARLLGAAIPCNQNIRPHLRLRRWWCDQDRSAAFKQGSFKCAHPRALRIATYFT